MAILPLPETNVLANTFGGALVGLSNHQYKTASFAVGILPEAPSVLLSHVTYLLNGMNVLNIFIGLVPDSYPASWIVAVVVAPDVVAVDISAVGPVPSQNDLDHTRTWFSLFILAMRLKYPSFSFFGTMPGVAGLSVYSSVLYALGDPPPGFATVITIRILTGVPYSFLNTARKRNPLTNMLFAFLDASAIRKGAVSNTYVSVTCPPVLRVFSILNVFIVLTFGSNRRFFRNFAYLLLYLLVLLKRIFRRLIILVDRVRMRRLSGEGVTRRLRPNGLTDDR